MEASRAERNDKLREERPASLRNALVACAGHFSTDTDILPTIADIAEFPEIKEMLEAPSSVPITTASFATPLSQLADMVRDWRRDISLRAFDRLGDIDMSETCLVHVVRTRRATVPHPFPDRIPLSTLDTVSAGPRAAHVVRFGLPPPRTLLVLPFCAASASASPSCKGTLRRPHKTPAV